MKQYLWLILIMLLSCFSCKTTEIVYQPVKETQYIDRIERVVDTIIVIESPEVVENIINPSSNDSISILLTSLAISKVLIVDGKLVKHVLKNKDSIQVKVQYIDRIETIEKTVEVPVEVTKEVKVYPTTYWIFLGCTIFLILLIVLKFIVKR